MLLSLIITNEKINLNFGIWAMRLNNDPRLIGLLKSNYPHKYQWSQIKKIRTCFKFL